MSKLHTRLTSKPSRDVETALTWSALGAIAAMITLSFINDFPSMHLVVTAALSLFAVTNSLEMVRRMTAPPRQGRPFLIFDIGRVATAMSCAALAADPEGPLFYLKASLIIAGTALLMAGMIIKNRIQPNEEPEAQARDPHNAATPDSPPDSG